MKKTLSIALAVLGVGLYAQADRVGINTTDPEKTLDVNGEVKVRVLKENNSPTRVVVVDTNNVLSTAPLSTTDGVVISNGGSGVYTVGKKYFCNTKNQGTQIFLVNGAIKCNNSEWHYDGLMSKEPGGVGFTQNQTLYLYNPGGSWFISGTTAYLQNINAITAALHVIDDTQYIP